MKSQCDHGISYWHRWMRYSRSLTHMAAAAAAAAVIYAAISKHAYSSSHLLLLAEHDDINQPTLTRLPAVLLSCM
jgi:uncharacterized protein involved in exopolysaccharide biosynthesis